MPGVHYAREGRVARIQLDHASAGNAFNQEMRRQMHAALLRYRDDDEAWIAVVAGEGADFCRGSEDGQAGTFPERREHALRWAGGSVEIWKPTIAALQGQCRGEGLALALACDLRVAEPSAILAADFGANPADPDVVAVWLLNLAGLSAAFELLWLGRDVDAEEAQQLGLVNRIVRRGPLAEAASTGEGRFPMTPMVRTLAVPDGTALTGALRFAEELLQYAPVTRNFQKETAYRSIGVPFHYAQTLEVGPNPYASEDRIEGTRAFVENRRPVWRNR